MLFNFCCCCQPDPRAFLHGRVALVTGASSGLGEEFALQLAPHVRTLLLVARRADRLEALRARLARPGLEIQCHPVDLADRAQLEAFLTKLNATEPAIDLLINNAGLGDHGLFESSDWPRVEAMLELNMRALTRITHALLPRLVRARRGAILNVSSIASFCPIPQLAVYAATKAYVTSFSEGVRAELRGTGVSVTALCPGPVVTEFSQVADRVDGPPFQNPEFFRVPPAQVVREALQAMAADRPRIIPGWIVWAAVVLLSLVPFSLVRLGLSQRRRRC